MLSHITTLLRYARRGFVVRHHVRKKHYHMIVGHGLEVSGIVLDMFQVGMLAKALTFTGVATLLIVALIGVAEE